MSTTADPSTSPSIPTLPPLVVQLDAATIDALADAVADRVVSRLPDVAGQRQLDDDTIFNSREAGAYLKLPMQTLYKLTARGELRSEDRGMKGAKLRIRKSWCDDWLEGSN